MEMIYSNLFRLRKKEIKQEILELEVSCIDFGLIIVELDK